MGITVGGVGLGLRWEFIDELAASPGAAVDFLEISPENYMKRGGHFPAALERVAARYPIVTHGLTLSLGGAGDFDPDFTSELGAFVRRFGSPWHSDHLCFSASGDRKLHDLLPLSFTRATARRVADRVRRVQDLLGVPMAVENVSSYVRPGKGEMDEAEFCALVCDWADCGLMLDVNNAYVNSMNFGFDVDAWMATAPLERVVQIHVAGHEAFDEPGVGPILLDTHGAPVADPVYALLERVLARTGPVPVLLERDQAIPPLDALLAEVARLRRVVERALTPTLVRRPGPVPRSASAEDDAPLAQAGEQAGHVREHAVVERNAVGLARAADPLR